MKKIFTIILISFISKVFSQNFHEINKEIKISDSLTFNKELRIYKKYSTTNGSEIFRIYQLKENTWKVELYKYYNSTKINEKSTFNIENLNSLNNYNRIWSNILDTHIQFLPDIKKIDYKLQGKTKYESVNDDYGTKNVIRIIDGIEYFVFFRNNGDINKFEFSNAESYLKHYPEVDELNSYSNILKIIREEFNIWKE